MLNFFLFNSDLFDILEKLLQEHLKNKKQELHLLDIGLEILNKVQIERSNLVYLIFNLIELYQVTNIQKLQ